MPVATECSLAADVLSIPRPEEWPELRAAAEARLEVQGLPTRKQEDWKYLDLKSLASRSFAPAGFARVPIEDCKDCILPEARGTRLIFVNGFHDAPHSNVSALPAGVRLIPLHRVTEATHALGSLSTPENSEFFANLNHARFQDGALVYVPKNVKVEGSLHVAFFTTNENTDAIYTLPRLFIVLEKGAELHLVEEYRGQGSYLTSTVVEVLLHENASLRHDRIQRESSEAFHFSTLNAYLDRSAKYSGATVSLGSRLSRQHPCITLAQEHAELHLDGLALLDQDQVSDTHSIIDHRVEYCTSRQLHKCIVDGHAHAIFNGQVFVRPGAQQTDAQQTSRNLLLSEAARVDTKPQLEIFADDVKCSHGAAVGQLDPEEMFYLQSRGLNEQTARNLLTYGFAADVLASIPAPSLRRQLRHAVMARTHAEELEAMA